MEKRDCYLKDKFKMAFQNVMILVLIQRLIHIKRLKGMNKRDNMKQRKKTKQLFNKSRF